MTSDPLSWQEFDPATGELPPGVAPAAGEQGESGTALTLLAAPHARRDGWAARACLGIAAACARSHGPVFLADLDLRRPELHRAMGVDNGEGITDLLLWGGSVHRVARTGGDPDVALISAGTVVPDPERVFTDPHWDEVARQVAHAGRRLLLYLPQDEPGALELARRWGSVVVLTTPGERELVLSDVAGMEVRAVLGPPAPGSSTAEEPAREEAAQREAPAASEEGEEAREGAQAPTGVRRAGGKEETGTGRGALFWILLVILAVVVAGWIADGLGFVEIPFAP